MAKSPSTVPDERRSHHSPIKHPSPSVGSDAKQPESTPLPASTSKNSVTTQQQIRRIQQYSRSIGSLLSKLKDENPEGNTISLLNASKGAVSHKSISNKETTLQSSKTGSRPNSNKDDPPVMDAMSWMLSDSNGKRHRVSLAFVFLLIRLCLIVSFIIFVVAQ